MLNKNYHLLQILQMLATQANHFAYDPQRTISTVLVPFSYILSAHLSVNGRLLMTLFQFPTFYSTSRLTLLQTVVLCLILHFLVVL